MDYLEEVVELIYLGEQPERFENLGIDVFLEPNGARFIDAHRPQVGGSVVEAEHVVLSTGSSPWRVTVHFASSTTRTSGNCVPAPDSVRADLTWPHRLASQPHSGV